MTRSSTHTYRLKDRLGHWILGLLGVRLSFFKQDTTDSFDDNDNQESVSEVCQAWETGRVDKLPPYSACLILTLRHLGWEGSPLDLAKQLPYASNTWSLKDLLSVLANVGFKIQKIALGMDQIDPRLFPCFFVSDRGGPYSMSLDQENKVQIFCCQTKHVITQRSAKKIRGHAYVISRQRRSMALGLKSNTKRAWLSNIWRRFSPVFGYVMVLSFFINLLALAVPLFILAIYDKVIGNQSLTTLGYLVFGMGLALITEFILRTARSNVLSYVGARMDYLMGVSVFQHILFLPPSYTEMAPVGGQLSRIKEFESIRDFFTSPLATLCFELPFLFIFIVGIAVLGGWLAAIPVIMIALYFVLWVLTFDEIRHRVLRAGHQRSQRQSFLVETLAQMMPLHELRLENQWSKRYRQVSADAAMSGYRSAAFSSMIQTMSNIIMMASGVLILGFGAFKVMDGVISVGALVAIMALVWRVLSPIQTGFTSLSKLENIVQAMRHLNKLMKFDTERQSTRSTIFSGLAPQGNVVLNRVSLRYTPQSEPALLGVSFEAKPGEVVAITGPNGSGKSSILKLVLAMYTPQAGSVQLDGIDVRQMDAMNLRSWIGYVPQQSHIFHGTIAENLRMVVPTASDDDLRQALEFSGVYHEVMSWKDQMHTKIGNHAGHVLSAGFQQRLALSRAYLRRPKILLMDEPSSALDEHGDILLMDAIHHFQGLGSTVLFITHRPSHMKISTKILFFNEGRLELNGSPRDVMPRIIHEAAG